MKLSDSFNDVCVSIVSSSEFSGNEKSISSIVSVETKESDISSDCTSVSSSSKSIDSNGGSSKVTFLKSSSCLDAIFLITPLNAGAIFSDFNVISDNFFWILDKIPDC